MKIIKIRNNHLYAMQNFMNKDEHRRSLRNVVLELKKGEYYSLISSNAYIIGKSTMKDWYITDWQLSNRATTALSAADYKWGYDDTQFLLPLSYIVELKKAKKDFDLELEFDDDMKKVTIPGNPTKTIEIIDDTEFPNYDRLFKESDYKLNEPMPYNDIRFNPQLLMQFEKFKRAFHKKNESVGCLCRFNPLSNTASVYVDFSTKYFNNIGLIMPMRI